MLHSHISGETESITASRYGILSSTFAHNGLSSKADVQSRQSIGPKILS